MSIKVMTRVWENYPGGGTELLSLLALADWSDGEGRCFPSMASIAEKVRLQERQAQRLIHKLIADGYVRVTGNQFGGAPGASRHYQIILSSLTSVTHDTPSMETGVTQDGDGCHARRETGVTHDTLTVIEPSITVKDKAQALQSVPDKKKIKKSDTTLKSFIEQCQAAGEDLIPDNDPIFEYAAKVGIDHDMIAVCWHEFKARHLPGLKRQKDWRAHFRNTVHRNWYKLWFIKDGDVAQWTTAGEQARRAAA